LHAIPHWLSSSTAMVYRLTKTKRKESDLSAGLSSSLFLDGVREAIRVGHYRIRTEEA